MSTDNLSDALRNLESSTKQLNALTDAVSNRFSSVELLFRGCNIGIEKWVDAGSVGNRCYELGFAYQADAWRIVIRQKDQSHPGAIPLPANGARPNSPTNALARLAMGLSEEPWNNSSRDVKLQCVKSLPALVAALQKEVTARINATTLAIGAIDRALPGKE